MNWMADVLMGLLNLQWLLSGQGAMYLGILGLSGLGHLVLCLRVVFCLEVWFLAV